MTNRPNLTEEEKEHYNNIALMKMNVCGELLKENEELKLKVEELVDIAEEFWLYIDLTGCYSDDKKILETYNNRVKMIKNSYTI